EVMARYLLEQGIPREQLLVERQARNTRENIAFSLDLVNTQGKSGELCVLTSDYHLYRARTMGRSCGVDLSPIPAITPKRSRLQQWCREVLTILYQTV
ncbi:MAG: YdcF family protein, partial [Coriobacteriales bacterium]|nr:YdcF family protein [Coriobacteriales bacterium]